MKEVFGKNNDTKMPNTDNPEQNRKNLVGLRVDIEQKIDDQLKKKSLIEVMESLGIPSSYNDRYTLIEQLYDGGLIIFDGSLNPPLETNQTLFFDEGRIQYIGNPAQNEKFKHQIIRNRNLFVDGKLPAENISKWQLEEEK